MRILVYGTGGVGGYFGAQLARHGNNVTFVARGKHYEAIKKNGLKVLSPSGNIHLNTVQVEKSVTSLPKFDLIIFGVKSWQLKDVVKDVLHLVSESTILLPLQNGIFSISDINATADENNIVGGLCKIISRIEAPGVINHMMFDPTIVIGELDGELSERITNLKELFENSKIHVSISRDIETELWRKFMFICSAGLGAITRSTYGEMRSFGPTMDLLYGLTNEIYKLGKHLNINLDRSDVTKTLDLINNLPCEATSSMQRDIVEGRPSELEYLNGAVVKLSNENNIACPINSFIYSALMLSEKRNRTNLSC